MHLRSGLSIVILAAAVAACSGSGPSGTQSGNGGNGDGPTDQPQATEPGNGNGNGGPDFSNGKVTFEVSGPFEASGEYGFIPAASIFGGAQGASLSFSDNLDDNATLVSILVTDTGAVVVSYAGPEGSVPAAECTTSNWNMGPTSGSGSFDCTAAFSIMASGASVAGGRITGSFEARA